MVDRRNNFRKDYKSKVLLRLNEFIQEHGYTRDISIGGICINSPELFSFLGEEKADQILNKALEVTFISESLTLQGTIIQVNTFENELKISISQISNPKRWMWLCK
jgi:glucuronate isomerase